MSDVWLCWFGIAADAKVIVTRERLRAITAEMGMSQRVLIRDAKVTAFRTACRTKVTYTDDAGAEHVITGEQIKATAEFITYAVVREDGYRVAEWKFFQSRRNRDGLVKGTHLTKSVLRRSMPAAEQALAQQWLSQAEAAFQAAQEETPHWTIRSQVNATLATVATPIAGRANFSFGYTADMPVAQRVQAFLEATMPGGYEFTVVALQEGGDRRSLAASADIHLASQLEEPLFRLERASQPGARALKAATARSYQELLGQVRERHAVHVRCLGHLLPVTDGDLERMQILMGDVFVGLPHQRRP